MVFLQHFENPGQSVQMDSTDTCISWFLGQSNTDSSKSKFGDYSYFKNYLNPPHEGGVRILELPELDAFTLEMWQIGSSSNTPEAGGVILYMEEWNSKPESILSGSNWGNYKSDEWTHCAWVRKEAAEVVEEYINGQKVAEIPFTAKIGGRPVVIYGGGSMWTNQCLHMDEVAIFNYAKYTENFEPPTTPYNDEISGLNQNSNEPREVSVSGHSIRFLNDSSFALQNPSSSGTSKIWETIDKKYFIIFDSMGYWTWVIKDSCDMWDGNTFARLNRNDIDDYESFDPINAEGWIDSFTELPINVISNN